MDCERCESLLVDYVSGDLPEPQAAEVRAALEVCEHCKLALAKLERGRALGRALPRVEPPPEILAAVMRAAEARAAELAAEREASRPPEPAPARTRVVEEAEEGPLAGIARWLAGLLHGPQFAMAALLVLMVGVGLWWVPALSGPRALPPPLVSDAPAPPEPTASLEPRAVPHLEIDPRTGRVVSGDETGPLRARPRSGETAERPSASPAGRAALAEAEATERPALLEPRAGSGGEEEADTEALAAAGTLLLGAGEAAGGRAEVGTLPSMSAPEVAAPAIPAAPVPGAPSGAGLRAPSSGERSARSSLDDSASGRATSDAVPAPGPDDSMLPAALHQQARLLAGSGSLDEASRAYERLLSEHDGYASAPRAMIELAEVHRRRGSLSSARRWLERAARFPSVATEARRELARLDAMERAAALDMAEPDVAGSAGAEAATAAER